MKKFISVFMAVTMLFSCMSLGVFAASESGEYALSADKTEVAVGETVTVTVSLKAKAVFNVEGILTPSENLEYVSHEILAGGDAPMEGDEVDESKLAAFPALNFSESKGKFAALGNFTGYTGDIDLLTVTYKANKAGSATVELSETLWTNEAGDGIDGNSVSIFVTVIEAPVVDTVIGDVNVDNRVNAKDATAILQYVAKMRDESEIVLKAADANADGRVNAKDATTILQYVAKKIPTLPPQK